MADLIKRLRIRALTAETGDDNSLLHEAAAALEAAREDGLRLEWLADNIHMIAKCGGLWFSSDGAGPYQDSTLRGAIDQARGKGGREVGP
jgi:hypothetical protein